jgi:hypothetical protein
VRVIAKGIIVALRGHTDMSTVRAAVWSLDQAYKEFPPRQHPASFSIDQVIEKLETTTKGK